MSSLQLALIPDPKDGPSLQELADRHYHAQLRLSRLNYLNHGMAEDDAKAMRLEAESERQLTATALALAIPNMRRTLVGHIDQQRYWVSREHGNLIHVRPYDEARDKDWPSLDGDTLADYQDTP